MVDGQVTLTLASILTVPGAVVAAGLVTGLIQVLKNAFPRLDAGLEKPAALVFSAILVVLALVDNAVFTLPAYFTGFVAWLTIAKLSTGIYDEATRQPGTFTGDVDSP